ncbi:hypothetical protein HUJ05_001182 [Dendroctonus ponderosae]|nr:hypothetical protein HUJ05_001182 [Dendroctonus ponderosae]
MEIEGLERNTDILDLTELPAEAESIEILSTSSSTQNNLLITTRTITLSEYLNSATNNLYSEYEENFKRGAYIALMIICVMIVVAYAYSKPGTRVQIKWKRSMRKMKRLSKTFFPSLKRSTSGLYPFLQDMATKGFSQSI